MKGISFLSLDDHGIRKNALGGYSSEKLCLYLDTCAFWRGKMGVREGTLCFPEWKYVYWDVAHFHKEIDWKHVI